MGSTYRSHNGGLPVKLEVQVSTWRYPSIQKEKARKHTRSSPIGPAEQELGGSLRAMCQYLQTITGKSSTAQEQGGKMQSQNIETYRPRSVNSLLIRLRAMMYVCLRVVSVYREVQSVRGVGFSRSGMKITPAISTTKGGKNRGTEGGKPDLVRMRDG